MTIIISNEAGSLPRMTHVTPCLFSRNMGSTKSVSVESAFLPIWVTAASLERELYPITQETMLPVLPPDRRLKNPHSSG